MKRVLFVVLTIALLLIPLTASADTGSIKVVSKSGDGGWLGGTWLVDMFPGEAKSTAITFYNSSCSSFSVKLSAFPASQDSGNLAFQLDKSDFVMKGKTYAVVVLTVKASSSATPRCYIANLNAVYQCVGGQGGIGCNSPIVPWWKFRGFFWPFYYWR